MAMLEGTRWSGRALLEGGGVDGEFTPLAILFELVLLGLVLVIGRLLSLHKVLWMGEAGAALLLGLVMGLILHLSNTPTDFADKLVFQTGIFLYVMLPTIMFDAGYSLDPKPFVRNVGSVCMFAFVGTTICTFVIGLLMYGFGQAGWCTELSAIHNLLFGAIISATDPVTVLAVFSRLKANEDLYINVFGESVLNDAVAMVLYHTLDGFVGSPVTAGNVFKAIGTFLGIFTGSVVFGVLVGLLSAYIFKTNWFHDQEDSLLETGMVVLLAFISYLGAQAAYMSGICSVLFCGMVMKAYATPNLSPQTASRVEALFRVMAGLFELFLFVYIGLTLFIQDEAFNIWAYTALVLLALAISRALNIFPLAAAVNYLRLPQRRMPGKQQFMLWWSGLRGAMAFALALDAADSYGEPGRIMKTCTFYVVLLTVLVNGGSAAILLDKLELKRDSGPMPLLDTCPDSPGFPRVASDHLPQNGDRKEYDDDPREAVGGQSLNGSSRAVVAFGTGSANGVADIGKQGPEHALPSILEDTSGKPPAGAHGQQLHLAHASLPVVSSISHCSKSVTEEAATAGWPGQSATSRGLHRLRTFASETVEHKLESLSRTLSRRLIQSQSVSSTSATTPALALTSLHAASAAPTPHAPHLVGPIGTGAPVDTRLLAESMPVTRTPPAATHTNPVHNGGEPRQDGPGGTDDQTQATQASSSDAR